jgi:hypothetical protein
LRRGCSQTSARMTANATCGSGTTSLRRISYPGAAAAAPFDVASRRFEMAPTSGAEVGDDAKIGPSSEAAAWT